MSTKINDDSMALEIDGRVIATAEFRTVTLRLGRYAIAFPALVPVRAGCYRAVPGHPSNHGATMGMIVFFYERLARYSRLGSRAQTSGSALCETWRFCTALLIFHREEVSRYGTQQKIFRHGAPMDEEF